MSSLMLIAIMILSSNCDGENQKRPLTGIDPPPDAAAHDNHACWSGTNNLIAYIHGKPSPYDPDTMGIYIINPDGSGRRLLIEESYVFSIDWSPDGQWLLANVGSQLWKISYPEGIVDTLLTNGEYYYPSWSPDGTAICYADRGGRIGEYILSLQMVLIES